MRTLDEITRAVREAFYEEQTGQDPTKVSAGTTYPSIEVSSLSPEFVEVKLTEDTCGFGNYTVLTRDDTFALAAALLYHAQGKVTK